MQHYPKVMTSPSFFSRDLWASVRDFLDRVSLQCVLCRLCLYTCTNPFCRPPSQTVPFIHSCVGLLGWFPMTSRMVVTSTASIPFNRLHPSDNLQVFLCYLPSSKFCSICFAFFKYLSMIISINFLPRVSSCEMYWVFYFTHLLDPTGLEKVVSTAVCGVCSSTAV